MPGPTGNLLFGLAFATLALDIAQAFDRVFTELDLIAFGWFEPRRHVLPLLCFAWILEPHTRGRQRPQARVRV